MAQYQSIPAVTHPANDAEQEDIVKKSIKVRQSVAGAVLLLLCVGFGVVATTQTFLSRRARSRKINLLAGPPAASAALLRATTTTGTGGREECCAPASGTWNDVNGGTRESDGPFEVCYYYAACTITQLSDPDPVSSCYCWSKSFWNGDGWDSCPPSGGGIWQEYGIQEILKTKQYSFCGTPCSEFAGSVTTC